ncbi:hypothetical protein TL16_g12132 [Triparma laevis f. inornata]|uniref:SSD domain-containing protein n=1 Tax=Triparma laevis f. inornata TaxID=1714386 RepID=A0A9W7BNJ1_9STRA|nr:hypothetical protein TL16_g12132 [Triparma laevis f. inornata]
MIGMGGASESYPWLMILFSILMTLIAATGIGGLEVKTSAFDLWVPTNMDAYKNFQYVNENFLTSSRGTVLLYEPKDKGNALRVEYLAEALAINKNLTTSTFSPTGLGYDHICDRVSPDLPCDFSNILMVFGYDLTTLVNMDDAGTILPTINNLDDSGMPLSIYLGGIERDADTNDITGAKILRLVYPMSQFNTSHPDRLDIMADVNDLEDTLQDKFYWDFNADSSRLANIRMITNKSVDDEIGRLIKVDSVLFVASIIAIVFILCCTFIKSPNGAVRSRFVAGLSAFVIIMFSIMFAFGMMGMIGVPMNSICIMICFVVAGVGVDDMIVIENFYNKSIEDGLPRGLRMAEALKHGGLSVFLTSASSVLAFASGTGLYIPGIVQFCTCGSLCFSWIFFLSITFFPAVLVLDQKRVEANMAQCMCCCCLSGTALAPDSTETKDRKEHSELKSSRAGEILTPFLTSPLGRILVPAICVAFTGMNGYLLTKNGTGLSVTDVVPDDSYVVELVDTTDEFWTGKLTRGLQMVFKGDHYADEARVTEMSEYFTWVEDQWYIVGVTGATGDHWYGAYTAWLEAKGLNRYTDFHDNLSDFLSEPATKTWRAQVTCTTSYETCTEIKCAQFPIIQQSKIDTYELYTIQVEMNEKVEEMGFDAFNFLDEFGYADADSTIELSTLQSLTFALAVVLILMILLMDSGAAVCIFFCVLFIDIDLLGMLYYWGVTLSSVSFTGLVMSIGLSVDYNVHIAHAFLHGEGTTIQERTKYTLDLMGGSVLKGGLTTFVGTVVLSMASSTAFRIFFKVCFGTVVFGIIHGVLLMPILLGYLIDLKPSIGSKVAAEP